jgi:hypothetical protein
MMKKVVEKRAFEDCEFWLNDKIENETNTEAGL